MEENYHSANRSDGTCHVVVQAEHVPASVSRGHLQRVAYV